jgi:hypothetical protein
MLYKEHMSLKLHPARQERVATRVLRRAVDAATTLFAKSPMNIGTEAIQGRFPVQTTSTPG